MKLELIDTGPEHAPVLANLLHLYAYDFSEFMGWDVGDDGSFPLPSLQGYWTDDSRHALLVRVDGKLAGLALVVRGSRLTDDPDVFDMAEFFVVRKHRRRGIGEHAARALFDRFRGRWEVRQTAANQAATRFWTAVIDRYSEGRFTSVDWDDARWRGPVQSFDSRAIRRIAASTT